VGSGGFYLTLAVLDVLVDFLVGGHEELGDGAIDAGPVEQEGLVFCGEVIFGIGGFDILIDAARWEAKEEAFEMLGEGGFVDRGVGETVLIELDIGGGGAENGFKDFLTRFDGASDGGCFQGELMHEIELFLFEGFFPAA